MKLKLDENLSRHLKSLLAPFGHDVTTAADEGLLSRPDADVANAAKAEGRVLLTLDLDFANVLAYPPGSHPGIVLFRPATLGPLEVNHLIEEFVRKTALNELAGCLTVVDPGRVRVRRP
jgi:predicted nuclease of predicted toxin-antitoxin system